MKIIFMGTPMFGAVILKEIIKKHDVILVVTQPDNKGKISAVKKTALDNSIPVLQPEKLRQSEDEIISSFPCDLIVTASYGQILRKKLLKHPRYGAINVHGSLLPMYRGGAPIQRAIMNGDKTTGVTILYMEEKLDSGAVLAQDECPINDSDTADVLFIKLANMGAQMINPVISAIKDKTIKPFPQDESRVSYAYNIKKEEEKIDFFLPAISVVNHIRGLSSNPGAYFLLNQQIIKVYQARFIDEIKEGTIGSVYAIKKEAILVRCGDYRLAALTVIKPAGSKMMSVQDFMNGRGRYLLKENMKLN